ncbi:class I SAM-dependent methyltransferase [Yoonia sediminilitoris]|uniref:Methyltransferase family protein n=1 Tax=Yoonia sediminilitoris TaxID=1286148 RepID=A0A2T6KD09_9RHOB|nr:class I SAM-dependent methyltransferase [Yoonia sediminilitoris]PUB12836.1 methyltransferase family protein [Yoonia sediminilitoris]RCW94315.1 methyltransferase family protein [Yoonia sediminilitoris]
MARMNMKKVKGDRYYGKTASDYETVRSKQPWWGVEQREMQTLLDKLPRDLSVVDIPFGTGRFVPYYLERGYKVHGLDASDAMLDTASEILGAQYAQCKTEVGLSTALPFADNEFDLLVSTRFLRDIILFRDVKTTMAEFSRVTKSYAIIQLGINLTAPFEIPPDDEKMSSRMSMEQTEDFLLEYGFIVTDSRFVKGVRDQTSEIRHLLCKKL